RRWLAAGWFAELAAERGRRGLGGEGGAVVELNVGPEAECPREAVPRHAPLGRQAGLNVAALADLGQPLEELPHGHQWWAFGHRGRVQRVGKAGEPNAQLARVSGDARGGGEEQEERERGGYPSWRRHAPLIEDPPSAPPPPRGAARALRAFLR